MKFIILAGGSGTRLWPLSRKNFPKQFLKLPLGDNENNESFFQKTLRRLSFYPEAELYIVTNEKHKFYVLNQAKEVLNKIRNKLDIHLVLEPVGKNTAPAIALALNYAIEKGTPLSEVFFVCPSDHLIEPDFRFIEYLNDAQAVASDGYIVTFGIKPTRAETGYGYIKAGEKIENTDAFMVDKFTEKPDLKTAEKYLKDGYFYWNSGMFAFRADSIIDEFNKYVPQIGEIFKKSFEEAIKSFPDLPDISIDYAVMEKTRKAAVLPLELFWSDIGSWESLYEILNKDEKQNAITGQAIALNTKGSLIVGSKRLISTVGVENLVVVETEDALLIAKKGDCQKVKEIVKTLSEQERVEATEHVTVYRPWGSYTLLEKGNRYKIKRITVNPGERLSLQMHHHRSEHWVVVKGTAKVKIGGQEQFVHENESVYVPKSTIHRLENPGKIPLEIIEVQVGEYVEEDDIKRFDDIYGRQDI